MTSKNWLTDPRTGHHHRDGTPWYQAHQPRRLHRCRAQTIGTHDGKTVYRCACGGFSWDDRTWVDKNSARR